MKKLTTLVGVTTFYAGIVASQAASVRLDNVGTSTGDNLDEVSLVPTTVAVAEVPGLTLTVSAITGNGIGTDLNATTRSFGINSGDSGDDTDAFDATFNESVTFSFNQAVLISQLDLVTFEDLDVFEFGSTTINFSDLSNTVTDIYDFSSPLTLAANEQFILRASSGVVGIEGIELTVVPEPSSIALLGLGGLALILRRRN